jgi:hypothetical protein
MAKRKSRKAVLKRTITEPKEPPGTELETIVARIQQMLDTKSRVTRNEWLVDRLGNRRQYDVVVRGEFGGRSVLGVIECKDHSRKKGPDAVEAFAKKTDNLRTNLRCMVSRKGFTKQALTVARHEGIECLSLLPDDPKAVGYSIGEWAYGRKYWWDNIRMHFHFPGTVPPIAGCDLMKVKWQGKSISNWIFKELNQIHVKNLNSLKPGTATAPEGIDVSKVLSNGDLFQTGDYRNELTFKHLQPIEIEGTEYLVSGLTFEATLKCQKKRKWAPWKGDAFYNWENEQFRIPAHGQLKTDSLENDLAAWPDYDGDLPDIEQNIRNKTAKLPDIVLNTLVILGYDPDSVPELESLEA